MRLYLASRSSARAELLRELGIPFIIAPADIDEAKIIEQHSDPLDLVEILAKTKAETVAADLSGDYIVVGCDTVSVRNGKILGKPRTKEEAKEMIMMLEKYPDNQYTGVCVISPEESFARTFHANYIFSGFREVDVDNYIASGEPFSNAGALNPRGKFAGTFGLTVKGYYHADFSLPLEVLVSVLRTHDLLPDFSKL
ncbi:septum formation protein Maf [Candidatus Woesearchaeota archaeon]|nr:septum formation protein Maf [Candidatus Woesearchaeota archaeon]